MNRPHGAWVGYIDLLLTLKFERQPVATVSYTHLTLPTTPYV